MNPLPLVLRKSYLCFSLLMLAPLMNAADIITFIDAPLEVVAGSEIQVVVNFEISGPALPLNSPAKISSEPIFYQVVLE